MRPLSRSGRLLASGVATFVLVNVGSFIEARSGTTAPISLGLCGLGLFTVAVGGSAGVQRAAVAPLRFWAGYWLFGVLWFFATWAHNAHLAADFAEPPGPSAWTSLTGVGFLVQGFFAVGWLLNVYGISLTSQSTFHADEA